MDIYKKADIIPQKEKLLLSDKKKIANYLTNDFREPVRDPIWKNIFFPVPFKKIIHEPAFQKLHNIKQLGPIFHIYPGATHTRFSHSLGVFNIARKMIQTLLRYKELDFLTFEGLKAFLCAALLHDIGHFPFAHSLKELPLKDHEKLTSELILSTPLKKIIESGIGTDPDLTAAIIDTTLKSGNEEVLFFRNILSGVLDPDKLDYLNRDAYYCGVPYGIQDSDYILNKIIPHRTHGIALGIDALGAVENILFSKYLMYKAVYWHKTVRIATAMIKKAVFEGLENSIIRPEDLYGLDDNTFYKKFGTSKYEPFKLIKDVSERNFYKCIYEIPFSQSNPVHKSLINLTNRAEMEKEISLAFKLRGKPGISPYSVIIDIPEDISFELEVPVKIDDTFADYSSSGSVFTPPVINGFVTAIRKIRIIASESLAKKVKGGKELAKWLN